MRAYLLRGGGRAAVEEVPDPVAGPGEVLLRVEATALNHLDVFVRDGLSGPGVREQHYPHVSGCDVVATVAARGPGVGEADWPTGRRVVVYPSMSCGHCEFCHRGETSMCAGYRIWGEQTWGGLAELTVAPAANLVAVPGDADPCVLAAAPVAFTTAWRALVTAGGLRAGETVLVVGVGGGVATAALAIARHAGARVLVTSRHAWKLDRARRLGASGGTSGADFDRWVLERTGGRGADLVLDSVGAATWRRSIGSLAPGGRLCVCGATSGDTPRISVRELYQSHRRVIGAPMGGRPDFDAVMGLVLAGELVPVVDSVHPLEEADDAVEKVRSGRQFGKVVVAMTGAR